MATHRTRHPEPVEGCQGCHYLSVQIGKGDLSPEIADNNRRDAQLVKDRAAYKALRADGLQPTSVNGSAFLESHVKDQIEIDYQIPLKEKDLPRVKEIQAEVAAATYATRLAK